MFLGRLSDWIGKPVPREIHFTFTPLTENGNHRAFGLKHNLYWGVQHALLI